MASERVTLTAVMLYDAGREDGRRYAAAEIARLTRELDAARAENRRLREALMTISMRCYEAVMQTPLLEHQSMHALAGVCKQDADAALAGQPSLAADTEVSDGE